MLNILYCLDENYNVQASNSIYSILENTKDKINVYIIHKNPESFQKFSKLILSKKNNVNFHIKKFDKTNLDFPNIDDSHVSEATYYRFYIDDYLPTDLEEVLYIDADIICMQNISEFYFKQFKELKNSEYTISVSTEFTDNFDEYGYHDEFNRLELKNGNYFNAGVMFIDLKKWKKNKVQNNLIQTQKELYGKISLWDQDVLNKYFDNNYLNFDKNFNFTINLWIYVGKNLNYSQPILEEQIRKIYFLHYAGKSKPWSIKGAIHPMARYYQEIYFQLHKKRYHISSNWKAIALVDFIGILFSKTFKIVDYKISFIVNSLRYFFTKK